MITAILNRGIWTLQALPAASGMIFPYIRRMKFLYGLAAALKTISQT
jgi:hypothetical protein